jgi:chemotaxis protein CheD
MRVSTSTSDVLVTYSLGSCVALSLFDPVVGVGGLIHCKLPVSKLDPEQARSQPQVFVDTGVTSLLQAVFDLGATRRDLIAKVIGAGQRVDENGRFATGRRNYAVVRKLLWKNNILIAGEDVGGPTSRSVFLEIATGQTFVRSHGVMVAV